MVFEGNTASDNYANGGAIYGDLYSTIELIHNGSVVFEGNTASGNGGAIYGDTCTIVLSHNGSVEFTGNTASSTDSSAEGGAIYAYGNLSIQNNDSVLFEKNAEISDGTYRLRSIYAPYGGDNIISLSAAAGRSIEFRDSVYIESSSTVKLNQDYTYQAEDGTSVTIRQQGDIIFTGKYAEQHLNELLEAAGAGRTATAQEILNSRTTEVNALTNLYGGRLRVEDGAIYQGLGITVHSGSDATVLVKDAELSHRGYDLTFNDGTTLELAGNNVISGNVKMLEGSLLLLNKQGSVTETQILGNLNLAGGVTLVLSNDSTWNCENGVLMYVSGSLSGWDTGNVTVTGAGTYGAADLSWVDNLLILNYNEDTFDKYFNGRLTYTSGTKLAGSYHHYESISFGNITSTANGRAIYGHENSTIELSHNGSVVFEGNTVSGDGGAIYGDTCTIELSDNESVVFEGNTSSSPRFVAKGGAIYVSYSDIMLSNNASTIELSKNGSVVFEGNTASGKYASGGAIYGDLYSTIELIHNGSVVFAGNTARVTGVSAYSSAYAYGGAIYWDGYPIELSNNGSVVFAGNTARVTGVSDYSSANASGGAIYGAGCTISLSHNGSVVFEGNTASGSFYAYGGAIYGYGCTIELSNNGSVVFEGNTASGSSYAYGGAIYGDGCTIELSNNGSVVFEGNTASGSSYAYGGAIYVNGNLSIQNNDSVLFEKNAEISKGTYRLRSIYAGGRGDDISLSAAAGRSIEFRDSVYIDSYSTVVLNADYGDTRQQGDIIFTGKYAEQHLNELLDAAGAGRTATAQEILNSRTTEVNALTYLYGGRLRVEDGAIYQGQGITVREGSDATVLVKDATLSHEGYALTFNAGTTLQVEGESLIVGDVLMMAQSVLNLEGKTTINGALTLGLGMQLAGNILAEVQNLQVGESLTLVSGLESLAVQTQNLMRSVEYTTVMDGYEVQASEYFSNLAGNTGLVMRYDSEAGTVSICNTPAVPEPTTATLSLLAFAALAARRRRK